MKYLITFSLAFVTLSCLSQIEEKTSNLKNGFLIYDISDTRNKEMAFMGFDTNYVYSIAFDSNNVRINDIGNVTVIDKISKEVLELYKSYDGKYIIYQTVDEMKSFAQSSSFGDTVLETFDEYKNILGYKCQKMIMNIGKQVTITYWTTDKIQIGIILPGSPFALENVALEIETKELNSKPNRLKIRSINNLSNTDELFNPIVPDDYYLVVPSKVYSWEVLFEGKNNQSNYIFMQYPTFPGGNEALKQYIKTELSLIIGNQYTTRLYSGLYFLVTKDGTVKDIKIINALMDNDKYIHSIKKMVKKMPKWIPGKVRGKPVNSEVSIDI